MSRSVILLTSNERRVLERSMAAEVRAWFGGQYQIWVTSFDEVHPVLELMNEIGIPLALCIVDLAGDESRGRQLLAYMEEAHPFALRAAWIKAAQRKPAIEALKEGHLDRYLLAGCSSCDLKNAIRALLDRYETLCRLRSETAGKLGRHIFLTGATGYLGRYLIRELLRSTDAHITCLTRGSGDVPYDKRLSFGENQYEGRLDFVDGDITAPGLGITDAQRECLAESVDEVWHLAASTSFSERQRDRTMHINVEGTKTMLAFASGLRHLVCFNHVSTAYVAGKRELSETVSREELLADDRRPEFRNPYEESKWLAERLVSASGLPHLIYRPSVLIGESYSGRSDGKTWYGAAKVFHVAKNLACSQCSVCTTDASRSFRVSGTPGATLNVIPVDWAVDHFLRLRARSAAQGSVFHVVHPDPVHVDDLMTATAKALQVTKWQLVPELVPDDLCWAEAIVYKGLHVFRGYMTFDDPVFDRIQTTTALCDGHCASLDIDSLQFFIQSYYEQEADALGALSRPNAGRISADT